MLRRGSVCCGSSRSRSGAPDASAAVAAIRSDARTGVRGSGRRRAARAIEADARSPGGASRASPPFDFRLRQYAPPVPVAPRSFATSDARSAAWIRLSRQHVESVYHRGPSAPAPYSRIMKLLYGYLRNYRGLIALALTLAAINQVFSLLDPLIFRHVIDEYATRFREVLDKRVLSRRQPAARGGGGRGVRLPRGEELPGLLHQRDHAAARCPALFGRHPALARAPVLRLRGSAQRRDARPTAESPHRRRASHFDRDQRAVHVARRDHLRDGIRVQRPLADRAGLFPDSSRVRGAELRYSANGSKRFRK